MKMSDSREKNKEENTEDVATPLSQPWRFFASEAALFALTMALGILAGRRLREFFGFYKVSPPSISFWQFAVWFIFLTLLFLWLIYFFKFSKGRKVILKAIFLLSLISGNLIFFGLWLPAAASFIAVLALTILWLKKPTLFSHNLFLVFAVAGIGARLGLYLNPETVVLLLVFFSIYDYIAVYKTKHMLRMAKEMIEQKAIIGIVIPGKISDFKENLNEVKPGGRFLILGSGDIAFPLIFAVSLLCRGISSSLLVAGFAFLGLLVSFLAFISQRIRRPIPALPPIALFSIIGYLISLL